MASFRASVAVLQGRPGIAPPAVLEAARCGVAEGWTVEDAFVDVQPVARSAGPPRVTVRFAVPFANDAEEDTSAWRAARALATAVGELASWNDLQVFRRDKGRWVRLDGPSGGEWPVSAGRQ